MEKGPGRSHGCFDSEDSGNAGETSLTLKYNYRQKRDASLNVVILTDKSRLYYTLGKGGTEMVEIRWHGRGGQGAKTAALLLADAIIPSGKYVQAFPEYGPERRGAPVRVFNRIDEKEIRQHSPVTEPDVVVVLDPTLIETAKVTDGLKDGGVLLVNTSEGPQGMRKKYGIETEKLYTVDASGIALETLGLDIPNTPMLGALARVTDMLDFGRMIGDLEIKLAKKFRDRPKIVKGNIESIKRAYEEVNQG